MTTKEHEQESAATFRPALKDSTEEKLRIAVEALKAVNKHLTIPAAEYVPAIPEAWEIIETALARIKEMK